MDDSIVVDIARVIDGVPLLTSVVLKPPASVEDALRAIGIEHAAVGVFGRVVDPSFNLSNGDRIELYDPLLIDPKAARRKRARWMARRR